MDPTSSNQDFDPKKTSFLYLPPELRNRIYLLTESLAPTTFAQPPARFRFLPTAVDGDNFLSAGKLPAQYCPMIRNDSDTEDENGEPEISVIYDDKETHVHAPVIGTIQSRKPPPVRQPGAATFFAQPNIAATSTQIRTETLPIFYGAITFLIIDLYHPLVHTTFSSMLWM